MASFMDEAGKRLSPQAWLESHLPVSRGITRSLSFHNPAPKVRLLFFFYLHWAYWTSWSVPEAACSTRPRALQKESPEEAKCDGGSWEATVGIDGGIFARGPAATAWQTEMCCNIQISSSGTDHFSSVFSVPISIHTGLAFHGLLFQSCPPCPHPSSDSMSQIHFSLPNSELFPDLPIRIQDPVRTGFLAWSLTPEVACHRRKIQLP